MLGEPTRQVLLGHKASQKETLGSQVGLEKERDLTKGQEALARSMPPLPVELQVLGRTAGIRRDQSSTEYWSTLITVPKSEYLDILQTATFPLAVAAVNKHLRRAHQD